MGGERVGEGRGKQGRRCKIRRRFEQPGMEQLIGLERIFADAAEGRYFAADDLKDLLGVRAADFDISRLSAQLVLLPAAPAERILQILQGKSADLQEMMDEVVRYLQLVFSVPATNLNLRPPLRASPALSLPCQP
ncbi:hypothetical protein HPB47_020971 [Ixodes persulcatus]|uniref:Uncharacterized protein n=1 Tax=Ixodes persulcatus TaxID=34615 RepID=A0AC60QDX8_IXOPE|nr:hypothetical protein HPB47_020971 [Ixodes persulcatus]